MSVKLFLESLEQVAESPYALVGYVIVVIVWAINSWRNYKLKTIAEHLEKLPEEDRLDALKSTYPSLKEGLDAETFLKLTSKQNNLVIILVTLATVVLIVCLAVYKSVEEKRLTSTIDTLSVALQVTRLGADSAKQNSFKKAAGSLESVLKIHPTASGYINLGYVYEEISDTDSAIHAYSNALKLEPNNLSTLNALGYLYKDAGEFEKAITNLNKAIEESSKGSEVWFMAMINRGNVEYEIGRETNDVDKRKKHANIALERFYLPAMAYKGSIKDQDFIAKTLANIGNNYKDTESFAEAEDYLVQALSIKRKLAANPSLAQTLVNMADLYLKQGEYLKAKPLILEAIQTFSITGYELGIGVGYFNLGDIHWAIGEVDEAKKYYQRSIDSFSISSLGGEYKNAPRRRLERMQTNNPPLFVLDEQKSNTSH
ncbi:tetratricopeptide repeat protein [Agarivorans sp. B2Z047]|uniref:tetratricopeptide repeat protein n=1 Tax=Agarivorans sp. B2Z047 TaxID=2652721 RepID=UPI00128DA4D8|nr:tetratricopeptide repeat protein [Agarivorans sp. B2Z047]MPW31539.1 tetratricopeptide repeat protein [Agarivorans sp. B2Z047]UQN42582.1 tetratricopeptide repeat protein [Agarivorans sp. B2Z047]